MAGILHSVVVKGVESPFCTDWIHHKLTRSGIPDTVFQHAPAGHEKYNGDSQPPPKPHIVAKI